MALCLLGYSRKIKNCRKYEGQRRAEMVRQRGKEGSWYKDTSMRRWDLSLESDIHVREEITGEVFQSQAGLGMVAGGL